MKVLPISILDATLQAIREGSQVQMRRPTGLLSRCKPGDCLWIRERFHLDAQWDGLSPTAAERQGARPFFAAGVLPDQVGRRRFARELPRSFHRSHLQVTAVRIERLHDLTEADALKEGALDRADFARQWDAIQAPNSASLTGAKIRWADNPQVVVLTFAHIPAPVPNAAFAASRRAVA
ncbi:hypothetical protein M527_07235 [Sphingobium indicum IP26]|uniref:ASCH domain-containing protein n=1 Tax=Sphingobium indicum F2 TaxID=1450518 RepID=A0A8E0WTM8_9SPHN|nr:MULTISPECIES: hypothetical protein [Sphingobium]EPR09910.1 hypothetical protein M527_07235 [Sphingobium indicum IP26]EQB05038.1 hypothetical protein L286_09750 [Sphingobium sp. HDIP04]KER36703.1 hypothetical protein AL00_09530 [Sphingobium indicum F2]